MSNAFTDIQTVYKTNYDYSSVNSNINFISVECKLSNATTTNVTIIKYTEMQKYEIRAAAEQERDKIATCVVTISSNICINF